MENGGRLIDCRICGQFLLISKGKSDADAYSKQFSGEHKHPTTPEDAERRRRLAMGRS